MTPESFNSFLDVVFEKHIKGKMCSKSIEYARNNDKLHNFKMAAQRDNISPEDALRGMDLKHRQSIADMIEDLKHSMGHPKEMWIEKITDHINYQILLLALIFERYNWEIEK